ncbi:MAG: FHA domain-containing protein [Phototrophicaceae bacterium]
MSADVVLLVLRLLSAGLLLGLLAALMFVIWRDYLGAVSEVQASRRVYGQLVTLQEIDGTMMVTGEVHPLLPVTSLGRAPTNTIVIHDTFASSEHAVVFLRGGQWWLEDRRSRNGTTLNGLPVGQPVVVTSGDIIGLGQRYFRLELER